MDKKIKKNRNFSSEKKKKKKKNFFSKKKKIELIKFKIKNLKKYL